jgi:hypothetical protein
MTLILKLAFLSCFASMLSFAGSWTGWLVDSKCYASLLFNRNAGEVSWDGNMEIRYCTPEKKTKSFSVVRWDDGSNFKLDPAGDEKASELPLSPRKQFVYLVAGETTRGKTVAISLAAQFKRDGPGAPGVGGQVKNPSIQASK